MININQVTIGGNVVHTPELKKAGELPICNFTIASNRSYWDKNKSETVTETEFANCVLFGKKAEAFVTYTSKGQNVVVFGRNKTTKYEAKDGTIKYKTDIICEDFQWGQKPQGWTKDDDGSVSDEDLALEVPPQSVDLDIGDVDLSGLDTKEPF